MEGSKIANSKLDNVADISRTREIRCHDTDLESRGFASLCTRLSVGGRRRRKKGCAS